MKKIIDKLEKYNSNNSTIELKNNKLNTKIICYSDLCKDKILEISHVFNNLFKNNDSDNKIIVKIIVLQFVKIHVLAAVLVLVMILVKLNLVRLAQ